MFAMGPAFFKSASGGYATLTLTGTFAAATVGVAYSSSIPISGGLEPYSLTGGTGVASGSLDSGFSLSITGTTGARFLTLSCASPTTADTMTFTASVDSSDGQTATSAQSVVVAFVPVPFDPTYAYSSITLSDSNYTESKATAGYGSAYGTISKTAGKWQIEGRITAISGTIAIGVADKYITGSGDTRGILRAYCGQASSDGKYSCGIVTFSGTAYFSRNDGSTLINLQSAGSLTTGDYLSVCVDLDAGSIAFYKNGALITGTNVSLTNRTWFPCASSASGGSITLASGDLVHPISGYAQWG